MSNFFALHSPHAAHFVSSDYVHWETRAIAVPSGEPDEGTICTGVVVEKDDTFYTQCATFFQLA